MNKKIPYEDAISKQLNDLPLPDEDQAWAAMKKLLEEDDDDTIVPPPVNKGCGLWGLLLLALLTASGVWYHIHFQKQVPKTGKRSAADTIQGNSKKSIHSLYVENKISTTSDTSIDPDLGFKSKRNAVRIINDSNANIQISKNKDLRPKHSLSLTKENNKNINPDIEKEKTNKKIKRSVKGKSSMKFLHSEVSAGNNAGNRTDDTTSIANDAQHEKNIDSSFSTVSKNSDKPVDSTLVKRTIEPKKTDTSSTKKESKKNNGRPKFYFAGGIAIQQLLPIEGTAIPYNYLGRKGSLADHIPSLYLRLYRNNKKWFIQSEFKYGAPNLTKEFVYRTQVLDTSSNNKLTAFYRLKKTYYHQLPLSFNYMVTPTFSLGTGIVLNRFYAAIAQQDIYKRPPFASDTLLSSKIINDKNDSNFIKNNFHWMFDAQYKWRRFTFGARYAMGMQPYIEYTDDITGLPVKKKDMSLYLFLRYELWNTSKKKQL